MSRITKQDHSTSEHSSSKDTENLKDRKKAVSMPPPPQGKPSPTQGRQSHGKGRRDSHGKSRSRAANMASPDNKQVFWDPAECISVKGAGGEKHKDDEYVRKMLYTPAAVMKVLDGGELMVKTEDGEQHRLKAASLKRVAPQDLQGVPDILQLNDYSEMSLLHTLRVRYERDAVYSFVGPILISINPYKWIPDLYEEATMLKYHGAQAASAAGKASPPHLFCVADAAYAALVSGSGGRACNQSIIISGESGAVSVSVYLQSLQRLFSSLRTCRVCKFVTHTVHEPLPLCVVFRKHVTHAHTVNVSSHSIRARQKPQRL